jgi:hypothetical protein
MAVTDVRCHKLLLVLPGLLTTKGGKDPRFLLVCRTVDSVLDVPEER